MNFKKGRNTIKPRTLRKLTKAIHNLPKVRKIEIIEAYLPQELSLGSAQGESRVFDAARKA